jgi:D-alanyl-D-alanine carboxypeptidase
MFQHNPHVPRQTSLPATTNSPRLKAAGLFLSIAFLFFFSGGAGARRHYYRQRYAPPASAMAVDLFTGRILYSKNANEPRYPASLTKVMTLYLLFDALRDGKISMAAKIRVSANAAAQSPTKLDLSEGDTISVADAMGAIVTKSANDMAVAVAEVLAGSEEEFARRMTQKARTIGMLNTTFRNASGLPNGEQRTTAQDLIILGESILADHPERCKVFATKYFQYGGEVFRNHNTLLFSYEGMEGMKTGFTSASGFNLIATAQRNGKRLLAVVLGGSSAGARNAAMRSILDNAWPKALTQVAAKKAGILTAAAKPKPLREEPPVDQARPSKPSMSAAAPAEDAATRRPAPNPAARPVAIAMPGPFLRLKRRPDRTSASMLLASIEAGLVANPKSPARGAVQAASDMTTDEPEDKAEREAIRSASYMPPPAREIARNETLAVLTAAPPPVNMSVHNKTTRPVEVTPLAAAALDDIPQPEPAEPARTVREALIARQEPPQTLAAATAAESQSMDQPGPYHVQVGAFSDREQAKERLENVKETLGTAVVKAHPEFIMPVSMPSGATMFRARLSRFSDEAQAKAACKKLKRNGIECWDIRAQ